ncbi:hypothetical protein K2P47_01575 [Patescibacteria group bacterium]|nr:hypothetical protein [Patescibacteria group bacterium]
MKLTASQVWEVALADPKFAAKIPEGSPQRDVIRPFVEGSVEVLADQLETVVSLQTIADAKMKFLRYCVDNGLGKAMGDATGMGGTMLDGMLEQLIEMLEPIVADSITFLEENGVTEEQVMLSSQMGLNPDNQEKWRAGTLTIGELLLTQPSDILLTDN